MRTLFRMLSNYRPQGVILPPPPGLPPPTPFPSSTNLGPHIVDYLRQPGDQVITVADGDYDLMGLATANPDTLVHAATGGLYGGWLVLIAQNKGGARIVSTADQKLIFDGGASGRNFRIALIGFDVDGFTHLRVASYLRFVYTDHTNPIDRWWDTYTSLGGTMAGNTNDRNILNGIVRWPSGFRMEPLGTGTQNPCQHVEFYGVDIHEIGDDAVYTADVYNCIWRGARIWNVSNKGHDPGPFPSDFFHSDGFQITGDFKFNDIRDSWISSYFTCSAYANGNIDTLRLLNMWLAGSSGPGIQIFKGTTRWISSSEITGVRAFCNAQHYDSSGVPHYVSGEDVLSQELLIDSSGNLVQFGNYPTVYHSSTPGETLYKWELPITGVDLSVPTDVRTDHGAIVDIIDLRDSAYNPANVWRAANTYADVLTWLGTIGWP